MKTRKKGRKWGDEVFSSATTATGFEKDIKYHPFLIARRTCNGFFPALVLL